jgi:site-specific DNA-cytosine methylase
MQAAGVKIVGGVEYDAEIAEVARANGSPVDVIDILQADPRKWLGVDAIHASPVCTRASAANNSAEKNEDGLKEAPLDIAMAEKTVDFVRVIRPAVFTLENVWQYRNFQSFKGGKKTRGIVPALMDMGYQVRFWHVNAADYGVPQTRRRLILVARLDGTPVLPERTHRDPKDIQPGQGLLFGQSQAWVGWYEAIEDLIPTLPESKFAPWQLERLPESIRSDTAWLVNTREDHHGAGFGVRTYAEPAETLTATAGVHRYRAFLADTLNTGRETAIRTDDEPSYTVTAAMLPKAFLVDGKLSTSGYKKVLQISDAGEPSRTVVSSPSAARDARAWLSAGRVVSLTTRALARFQTFPDSYTLPDKSSLACKGIGNAVPPRLIEQFYAVNQES